MFTTLLVERLLPVGKEQIVQHGGAVGVYYLNAGVEKNLVLPGYKRARLKLDYIVI